MIVVCVMIASRETGNNGILKMLALPVSRYALSAAKFCVLIFYLFMEMVVFLAVFVIGGLIATKTMGVTETLPIFYLLKWCFSLFLTMLPCVGTMWAITVLFGKPPLSVGLNLLLVIPGVLVANTPLWIAYPYTVTRFPPHYNLSSTRISSLMHLHLVQNIPIPIMIAYIPYAYVMLTGCV